MGMSRNCVTTHFLMFMVGRGSVMVPVAVSSLCVTMSIY